VALRKIATQHYYFHRFILIYLKLKISFFYCHNLFITLFNFFN